MPPAVMAKVASDSGRSGLWIHQWSCYQHHIYKCFDDKFKLNITNAKKSPIINLHNPVLTTTLAQGKASSWRMSHDVTPDGLFGVRLFTKSQTLDFLHLKKHSISMWTWRDNQHTWKLIVAPGSDVIWFVTNTAMLYSSEIFWSRDNIWANFCCRSESSPLPLKSTRNNAIMESTTCVQR